MKPLSCALLALAAAIALWGQPTWGYTIKHTKTTGEVVDSGYTQDIDLSGTVAELKERLVQQYQVPKDGMHLQWMGEEKLDQFELGQLRGSANYNLHLLFDFFLVRVVKPGGSYIIVGGEREDTVASFKDKITKRLNIPREMQRLMGTTGELQDGEKLENSLISDRTSYVVSLQLKSAQVRVKFPSGEIITFEYEHSDKVSDLKEKIQQAKGIAREQQGLLLKSKGELEDEKLLLDSGLTKSSILTLVERDPDELDMIHVRLASKRLLTFEVNLAKDTVVSLKEKISRAEGIAQQNQHLFLFRGNEMGNSRLLSDYVTKTESVVELLLCSDSRGGKGGEDAIAEHHIHWEPSGDVGPIFTLNIKPNDTVASVKQALIARDKSSAPPPSYTLHVFSDNKELEDERPMLEHVLSNGSLVQLTLRRNDGPQIVHVRLPSGRLITFEIDIDSQVKELKELIEQEMGANQTSRKRLFLGNQELGDDKSLYDCHVMSGSTVNLIVAKPGDYLDSCI